MIVKMDSSHNQCNIVLHRMSQSLSPSCSFVFLPLHWSPLQCSPSTITCKYPNHVPELNEIQGIQQIGKIYISQTVLVICFKTYVRNYRFVHFILFYMANNCTQKQFGIWGLSQANNYVRYK